MIRTVTILSILFLTSSGLFAQNEALQRVFQLKAQQVNKVNPKPEANTLIIPSAFSEESLQNTLLNRNGDLQTVYYIYTSYKQSPSFNQKALNEKRIKRLSELVPETIENRYVEWKIIEQTGCTSPVEGKTFFHGFVLEFRPPISEAERDQEIQNLEVFLANPNVGYQFANDPALSNLSEQVITEKLLSEERQATADNSEVSDLEANFPDGNFALYQYFKNNIPGGGKIALNRDDLWVDFDIAVGADGTIGEIQFKNEEKEYVKEAILKVMEGMPDWDPAKKNGKPVASQVNLSLRMSYSPIVKGMYNRDGKKPSFSQEEVAASAVRNAAPDEQTEARRNAAENSSVYKAMEVVIPNEKVSVVMDVTSSMSLHLASMNWWLANSPDSLNIVHYTFFNDGDNIEDRKKKVGSTGGIYHGVKLRDLPATLLQAMRNGNGGDVVENDFEALAAAQTWSQDADALLLIVDNFSDVRDAKLISQISKKTHILVAGDVTVVRACYLNLAKATGGDLLVNGNRVSLENVQSGGRITVANSTYIYNGSEFTLL
ncbi:MAG: hypothetical protein Crog3KO_27530 [Crocinitomicaceae bacterium]